MLNISGGMLLLGKSRVFIRFLILINSFTMWMIYQSGFSVFIKITLAACLLFQLIRLLREQTRALPWKRLVYQNGQWFLHRQSSTEGPFDKHRILLEAGIFFLLQLSDDKKRTLLVVFFDQLDADDYRSLRLLEKIT